MLELCSHEFLWPQRAADGGYYQSCFLCGAEYKYDWNNMRRTERIDSDSEATSASGLLSSDPGAHLKAANQLQSGLGLKLLLEVEPAYRVFFRNLADLVFHLPRKPLIHRSRSASFWREALADSNLPWRRFLESMLCHVIAVAAVVILSQVWTQPEPSPKRRIFDRSYVSYYHPSQSFPALRSGRSRARTPSAHIGPKKPLGSEHQPAIRVAAEHAQTTIKPPDIKLTATARPNIAAPNPALPAIPLSATGHSQLSPSAGPTSVVAPPPEVTQAASGRPGLLQTSVVAPPAEVEAVSSRPAMAAFRAAAVAPAPTLDAGIRRVGDINIGHSDVVGPAPRLPESEQRVISGTAREILGVPAASVVPPPPSVQRSETLGDGRPISLSSAGLKVVPPPPSVVGAGNSSGSGRANALPTAGLQVVPPPPSVGGAGSSGGSGLANSLSNAGLQAVPPPPSVADAGRAAGTGRTNSLSGAGLQGLPPAAAVAGAGSPSAGERTLAVDVHHAVTPPAPPQTGDAHGPATEELPLRLIGLALALPSSSYFSNYEVFIAEKAISKVESQLIKLVYVSLPYQLRLSEYGLDTSRVYKLRVRRDSTCDESLLQMTWPETDPHPDPQRSADAPALSRKDRNDMLPCYRTTADDNRKALSRAR